MRFLANLVLWGLVGVAVLVAFLAILNGKLVTRAWVSRFASRQALAVNPVNGVPVVRALAVINRWRRFGLASGFVLAALWSLQEGRLDFNFTAMFLGWFVGSLVAEWRINPAASGTRRRADLNRRTLASYVTAGNRILLGATLLALAGFGAWAGVVALGDAGVSRDWLGWALTSALGASALWAVTRRIVNRPRPVAASDLMEADDALRGQSLTVIAGSAIALAGLPLTSFVAEIATHLAPKADASATVLIMLVALALGWHVASRSASVRAQATPA